MVKLMNEIIESKTTAPPTESQSLRVHALKSQAFDAKKYEFDFSWKSGSPNDPWSAHSTVEMLKCLEKNPKIELDSRVLGVNNGQLVYKKLNNKSFKEAYIAGDKKLSRFKEWDAFSTTDGAVGMAGRVGQDFTPLLGGPFYKNLYYYEDYIRMHAECFFAYHNDPIAKAIVAITRDFVLGTGFEVQCDTSDNKGKLAMATWKSFEIANDLQQQIDDLCNELSIYGETMLWWLPKKQAKITYQLGQTDTDPLALIPRVRLLDPSNMVEIVTYPEDITRKLFYVWLTPTQYQIFTGGLGSDQSQSQQVQPSLKFIYRQIAAAEIMHYRVNAVSNEKRGRSDLFPVLSYLKRLRDSVNYSIIALQKASAWSIDTEVDGAQSDIDAYVAAQAALGTIPPAGSEFVHSKAIKRNYLNNTSSSMTGMTDAFQLCLSMVAAGVQIPISYFGTYLSGGQTRASAIVATEPVAKKMEKRREVIKRIIKDMWTRLMRESGLGEVECRIIFPEIITQDRSQKLKDLVLAQQNRWLSPQRVGTMAAKELGVPDYKYEKELENMEEELPKIPLPLTDPGKVSPTGKQQQPIDQGGSPSAITQDERSDIKRGGSKL
jgi:hypothetical protein